MRAASRSLRWLIGVTVVLTIGGVIGTAIAPSLLKYHPLLLLALSPLDRHMVFAASVTPLVPFLTVAAGRRTLSCAIAYGFARYYGDDGVHFMQARYPRFGRFVARLLRAVKRASPVVILLAWSTPLCGGIAGAAGLGFLWFLALALAGQLIWAGLAFRLSMALGDQLRPIIAFLSANVLRATLVSAVLVAIYVWRRRRQTFVSQLPPEPPAPGPSPPESPRET